MTTSPGFTPTPWLSTSSPGWSPSEVSCLTVTLGPIRFATSASSEPPGPVVWGLHEIEGWDDALAPVTESWSHPVGHGARPGMWRLPARSITLSGLMTASAMYGAGSPGEAADVLRRLRSATLTVAETNGLSREARVRVVQGLLTRVRGAARLAHFTITLTADDPTRYGTGAVGADNGEVSLPNRGDMTAWPLVDVTGPVSLTITAPTGVLTVAVPSGAHTIDCRDGVVWSAAGARVPGVASGPWPCVRPGGDEWTLGGLGSSQVAIRHTEAWS